MNSYPPELLAQLAPVMFVAGLDPQPGLPPVPPKTPTTPLSTPSTPHPIATSDPFNSLILRLRDALTSQRKVAIWQPEKSKTFHVVLVDRDVRFPPRKLVHVDDPSYASSHSPLSPLTPSSPLHPDGIIAPIWIRKHTTLIPSVFVLFIRLFEYPVGNLKSPLEPQDADREKEREAEERRRDTELANEIAVRKRSATERGIKLTVVLLASRKMLDDPALDARLTFIRRHSGLDSRAALFVLSPVSQLELGEFVKSLSQALYESALEYYTSHSKRVRRKRNRHSTTVSSYTTLPTMGNIPRPLRPEGWTVRYEYKMACFAEFRGEDEVALKHYQDAYGTLLIMFGSPAILPPRTKRWAEAKVLADTINIKITKLYLYNNEHGLALSHHTSHMRKFGDFSRGWGIGEETFEFWSWMARQNRILAELVEQGIRSPNPLTIPTHKPQLTSQIQNPSTIATTAIATAITTGVGMNPSHALQHPGHYYYAAAKCTELRKMKFLVALEAEQQGKPITTSPGFTNEKKVDHDTLILELYTKAYELFKKYNPGDTLNQGQGRLTLWIAYRIAGIYCDSGKYDLAIRFFERIAKTYRRENWGSMLQPLLKTWYLAVKQLGDIELSLRLLLEMMGYDSDGSEVEDPSALQDDFVAVLKSTVPVNPEKPLVLDISETPLFTTNVVFWSREVKIGETVAFQVSLTAPTFNSISSLPISSIKLYLEDDSEGGGRREEGEGEGGKQTPTVVIRHNESRSKSTSTSGKGGDVQWLNIGDVSAIRDRDDDDNENGDGYNAYLRWDMGSTLVISGSVVPKVSGTLKVVKVVATLEEETWKVEVPLKPCRDRNGQIPLGKWLSSVEPPRFTVVKRAQWQSTIVKSRPHQVLVKIRHEAPAYLDEQYPIRIEITNSDEMELEVAMDVLLQPTEIDSAVNSITIDGEQSSSLIRGIQCGKLIPGVTAVKTLYLINTGAIGDRMLDFSIQSKLPSPTPPPSTTDNNLGTDVDTDIDIEEDATVDMDVTEKLQTILVPTVDPFKVKKDVKYQHTLKKWDGLADLRAYEEEYVDDGKGKEACVDVGVEIEGPWGVCVESVSFEQEDETDVQFIDSSLEEEDDLFPGEFMVGDEFNALTRFAIPENDHTEEESTAASNPGHYLITWRRISKSGKYGEISETRISIPVLKPPRESLVALLEVPVSIKLHVPFTLTLSIRNYHPTQSANVLCQMETESFDTFVASGLRSGRLPILLPGTEERISWRLVPMECGHMILPKIKVFNSRRKGGTQGQMQSDDKSVTVGTGVTGSSGGGVPLGSEGEVVDVVDVRRDGSEGGDGVMSVLVLP